MYSNLCLFTRSLLLHSGVGQLVVAKYGISEGSGIVSFKCMVFQTFSPVSNIIRPGNTSEGTPIGDKERPKNRN